MLEIIPLHIVIIAIVISLVLAIPAGLYMLEPIYLHEKKHRDKMKKINEENEEHKKDHWEKIIK